MLRMDQLLLDFQRFKDQQEGRICGHVRPVTLGSVRTVQEPVFLASNSGCTLRTAKLGADSMSYPISVM